MKAQTVQKIRISRELAKKLLPLTMSIGLIIAIIAPGTYAFREYNRIHEEAGMYASQLADSIRQLAAGSPSLWKYQATKYSQIIQSFVPFKGILRIDVLDEQSKPINQFDYSANSQGLFRQFGIAGNPAPIIFNNNKIGEVRVTLAGDSYLLRAIAIFIVCLLGGTALSLLIYRLPLGVVMRLENELLTYQNSLEEQVEQRTAELQETAARALQLAEDRRRDQDALLEAKATLEQRVLERTRELQTQVVAKEKALAELAAAQSSLVEASRASGMAEVATGILHNVGNVLNSVNVSSTLLMDQLRNSRLGNLSKVTELMAAPEGGLAHFLLEDPRGRQIPAYLSTLASALREEQKSMLKESESLHGRIEHIKEIVTMQQRYGRVFGVKENISPEQLMEDALQLNSESLAMNGIRVQRQYEPVPPITVEKHSVLQILLNLLNNAKHACNDGGGEDKAITLKLLNQGSERIRMQVADNGIGILPENMNRIFQYGFTTRQSGHGFGLHSGALAARNLGGSLTAQSDGPGLGAIFTLELPTTLEKT